MLVGNLPAIRTTVDEVDVASLSGAFDELVGRVACRLGGERRDCRHRLYAGQRRGRGEKHMEQEGQDLHRGGVGGHGAERRLADDTGPFIGAGSGR